MLPVLILVGSYKVSRLISLLKYKSGLNVKCDDIYENLIKTNDISGKKKMEQMS